ncbi:MAG: 2-haloacid dehalogenase [bacterium]|jgi:2-haloacid dehalogenase
MSKPSLPTPVKALLFDVFGTVVDWRGSIDREMKKFGEAHSIEQDWQQFALDWRALYQPAMEKIREGDRGYVKLDLLHRENLQELLADYGLQGCDEAQLQFINSVWHRLRPWADTLPGMNRLKRNFTLGSLSNGNIALMVNMARHSGIPWDAILGSEPTRGYKPQPHVYLDSVEMLGLKPNQCLMVAAHNDDLHAARAVGLQTAYINRPYEYGYAQTVDMQAEEEWDIVCESMTELADELGC